MKRQKILEVGEPVEKVPEGWVAVILRDGKVVEIRPITKISTYEV